ncbi:MAG: hypothetical protein H6R15_780 [Proteobacteria bacterium]|nr:hypothetical protein [Pseudomonadota bacterium]
MDILHKRIADIDVHRMKHVITVLIEDDSGQPIKHQHEFPQRHFRSNEVIAEGDE